MTAHGRANLANDPVTAAFVAAAMRLIQRYLGPRPDRPVLEDVEDLEQQARQGFLSQRQVAAKMCQGPSPFPREGTVAGLRDRWKPHSRFIADVTRFCLWEAHYPGAHQDEITDVTDDIIRPGSRAGNPPAWLLGREAAVEHAHVPVRADG